MDKIRRLIVGSVGADCCSCCCHRRCRRCSCSLPKLLGVKHRFSPAIFFRETKSTQATRPLTRVSFEFSHNLFKCPRGPPIFFETVTNPPWTIFPSLDTIRSMDNASRCWLSVRLLFIIAMRRGWGGSGSDFASVTKTPVALVRPCFFSNFGGEYLCQNSLRLYWCYIGIQSWRWDEDDYVVSFKILYNLS